jgi:hypothetical protein
MHQKRFRKAERLPGQPLHAGSSRELVACALLRLLCSDFVMVWCAVATLYSGLRRRTLCETTWSYIFVPLATDRSFMDTTAIGQDHTTGMIHGLPSPALLRFLPDKTPPLIHRSGFNLMNFHCGFL